ncbi:MAG TPA: helix-turn-helix transcriptional regulator [Bacillaceae bacterium]
MRINLEIIKEKRKEKGFNIDEMADLLGLTNGSMYWKREKGHYKFKPEEVMMVANILQVPMDQLFLSNPNSKIEIEKKKVVS